MKQTLEHKCCFPECENDPASVMIAKNKNETLSFYACKPHEPAVWNHVMKTYIKQEYSVELKISAGRMQ